MTKGLASIAAALIALAPMVASAQTVMPPPNGGTVSIEPKTTDGEYDAATASFVNAASDALAAKGFTILPDPGHAAYVAELILSRADVGTGRAKAPAGRVSAGPGGAYGSVGAGIAVPFSTGESRLVPLQRTRLEIRIRKRDAQDVVWAGTAVTVRAAGTRKGADDAVASALSEAALRSYPTRREDVVGVP